MVFSFLAAWNHGWFEMIIVYMNFFLWLQDLTMNLNIDLYIVLIDKYIVWLSVPEAEIFSQSQ